MANCVVIPLRPDEVDTVEALWADLDNRWGLRASDRIGPPHLTLAIVTGHPDVSPLVPPLQATADLWAPFAVSGAGYGLFIAKGMESPVVHLAVTRTPRLSALHDAVAHDVVANGFDLDGQTSPEHWRPHVTLADRGLDSQLVGEVMAYLATRRPRHWTIEVEALALVRSDGEVVFRSRLRGEA